MFDWIYYIVIILASFRVIRNLNYGYKDVLQHNKTEIIIIGLMIICLYG